MQTIVKALGLQSVGLVKNFIPYLFIVVSFINTAQLFAAEDEGALSNSTVTMTDTEEVVVKKSAFKIDLSASYNSNLVRYNKGQDGDNNQYIIIPSYKINEEYTTAFRLWIIQDLTAQPRDEFQIVESSIGFRKKAWNLTKAIKLSPALGFYLPGDFKNMRQRQSLIIGVTPSVRFILDNEALNWPSFSSFYNVTLKKNIHEYNTASDGKVNSEYSSSSWFNMSYKLSDKWSVSGDFVYVTALSYQKNLSSTFSFGQEVAYEVNENMSLAFGHGNEASVLKENGVDSNIDIWSEKTSTVYGSISLSY